MAFITADKPTLRLSTLVSRPFVWVWNGMIAMAEANPKMVAIDRLNAQSDADLAARGTNREAEIRRIFQGCSYL